MKKIELASDEVILYEGLVKYGSLNKNVKLTVTNKRMVFEKEKGLFKKYFYVFEEVYINNIKVFKEEVQIKQNKENITIQAIEKNINISCSNNVEAKRIVEEIVNIRTGSSLFERRKNKICKTFNYAGDFIKIGIKAVLLIVPFLPFKGKEKIINYLKNIPKI